MNQNLYALIEAAFPRDRSACAIEGRTPKGSPLLYSWNDLDRASAKIANLLKSLKIPAGSRVAVQTEKSVEALVLYLATLRAGFVFLPLNTAYQQAEIEYFVANASPAVYVCAPTNLAWTEKICKAQGVKHLLTLSDDRKGSLLQRAAGQLDRFKTVERCAEDMAAILYTSGTTGRSKGAMLSHGNLSSNALTLKKVWAWEHGDVLLHMLPIFHVHGLFVASHGALLNGSKMIWHSRFDAKQAVADLPRATVFMGVPTMYVRLIDEASFDRYAVRNMRLFVSGSAPLLTETFAAFETRTGKRILERYGMSETVMLTSNPSHGERIGGTVGPALPGVHLRITNDQGGECATDEIGAIEVKGPNVFAGYWQMPEKTKEEFTVDGFFKTGDVGKRSANAYITIVGRSKDLIISGGYNVYPKEIESFIDEIDGVLESAVIGVPHRDFGEAVTAVVVAKPGVVLNEAAIIALMKSNIAGFKVPKRIHIVSELPRNQMGKVQKSSLRQQFAIA
jgi:malonyl-CoA/methylmalonyl-CoA synthetase